jgi:predicted metal-dependent hydrolase
MERFIARFDRGEFWLAHEELEALWLVDRQPALKGLIHLAAASLHAERGNWSGAVRKIHSSRSLLAERASLLGLDLERVRCLVENLVAKFEQRSESGGAVTEADRFALRPAYDGEVDLDAIEQVALPHRVTRYEHGYRPGRDPQRRDD